MRLCIVCQSGPLSFTQDLCCSERCKTKYAQDNVDFLRRVVIARESVEASPSAATLHHDAKHLCRVCAAALSSWQRLYCSRRCNHKAAWARRKLREVQALATRLEAEATKTRLVGLEHVDGKDKLVYAEVTQAEQFSRLVTDGRREIAPPSLWQRLRRGVRVAWATLVYLVQEQQGN